MIVIDGSSLKLGRLASHIAKKLISGEKVSLINAENIVILGKERSIVNKYKARRGARNKANPEHSPKWPRVPYLLVKKIIGGMLPSKTLKGRAALKKLMVYTGNPKNLEVSKTIQIEDICCDKTKPFITIEELCKRI